MKRSIRAVLFTVLISAATGAHADDISNSILSVNQKSLDAFAKDVAALTGAGSFHTGEALGFPLGFDVGAHAASVELDNDDAVLRDDSSKAISKWAQAEVGLPFRLNLVGRVGKVSDADAYGGGLRLGLLKSVVPGIPNISITGLYNVLDHDDFDGSVITGNAVLSFKVPFIHPYIGAGYDHATIDMKSRAGTPASVAMMDASEDSYRVEAGVNLSLIPFTYITLAGGVANGKAMYHAGLGVKI